MKSILVAIVDGMNKFIGRPRVSKQLGIKFIGYKCAVVFTVLAHNTYCS